jgi:mycothiol synthase
VSTHAPAGRTDDVPRLPDGDAAPLPVGYALRPPSVDDAEALLALVHAYDVATLGHPDFTLDDVRDELGNPRVDHTHGDWAVTGADGRVVAWAHVVDEGRAPDGEVATEAALTVHPQEPAAGTVGRGLVARVTHRVGEVAAAEGADEARVDCFVATADGRTAGWFADAGFTVVRRFSRLEVALTGDEAVPSPSAGVTVRLADTDADLPVVHRLLFGSFADHFGFVPQPYEEWAAQATTWSTVDRSQWWVAEVDGEPAGLLVGNRQWEEENGGWVKNLGVLPAFRGRGLGRLLLRHALADMARRGRTQAGLGVDTANETGALALYESVGFAPVHSADVWRRRVPAAVP